jgi:hypothetical protein
VGAILLQRSARGRLSVSLWAAGFAAVAVAAALGGTWHGFSPRLPGPSAALLWKATLAAGGFASFFLVAGAALGSVRRRTAVGIVSVAAAKLAVFLAWAAKSATFHPVVFDSILALAAILALQLVALARRGTPGAPWILAGVLVSFGAAAIEALRPALSPIGPDAVYHLVQIVGLLLFFRGGLLLENA